MATVLKVPQMGESVVEGTINKWFVEVGQPIKKDQPIVELLTDKVNVSLPADADGVLLEILAPVGAVVPVGKDIAIIGAPGEKAAASVTTATTPAATVAKAVPVTVAPVSAPASGEPQRLSPAVRRLIKEYGVDVTQLQGTGAGGRVTQKDVEDYITRMGKPAQATAPASTSPALSYRVPATDLHPGKRTEEIPTPRIRKLISDHMIKSRQTSAHVTTFDECDFTRLVEFRQQHVDRIEKEHGVRITYMPFLIAAACKALGEFPYVNASLTEDKIILKHYYNIGVAVARDTGLIVPVIKDADSKGLIELMRELKDLGDRARNDRLMPADIEDGTFSITNAGVYGALNSTPIISQPQVAILGVHTIQKRPVVRDGQIVIRDMMNLAMSFDHRLIDGHYAVQFLRRLITYLEAPELMLL
jgi:2-oxoglutarate dehydrogenase E2 component (dihydrolipoamide succinyltransferase)